MPMARCYWKGRMNGNADERCETMCSRGTVLSSHFRWRHKRLQVRRIKRRTAFRASGGCEAVEQVSATLALPRQSSHRSMSPNPDNCDEGGCYVNAAHDGERELGFIRTPTEDLDQAEEQKANSTMRNTDRHGASITPKPAHKNQGRPQEEANRPRLTHGSDVMKDQQPCDGAAQPTHHHQSTSPANQS